MVSLSLVRISEDGRVARGDGFRLALDQIGRGSRMLVAAGRQSGPDREFETMTGRLWFLLGTLALAGCAGHPVRQNGTEPAVMGSADRGAILVQQKCAGCHAVERSGSSPMGAAPPFRDMGVLYPVRDLQEAFAEGLVTAHPAMPAFEFEPDRIADVIAYIEHVSGTGPGR